ncbi:L,D-transpeptidase [Mesorhizobium australicum]|uniref:L,D-transpeptidase n=1 Tax=Mesorhizobium australicum TaxID=536018 RepID=UPI0033398E14
MAKALPKLISTLSNSVHNYSYKVDFGTVVDGGWFSASPDDVAVRRSIRTNDPGALNARPWQQKRPGYVGETPPDKKGNRTAIFQTPECGVSAWYYLIADLYGFGNVGSFSITALAKKYAGPHAAQAEIQAYVDGWAKWSDHKLDGNTNISLASNADMLLLAHAMFKHEAQGGMPFSDNQILNGIDAERKRNTVPARRVRVTDILPMIIDSAGFVAEAYESGLEAPILALGRSTLERSGPQKLREWLTVFAAVSDTQFEDPANITLELYQKDRNEFEEALETLSVDVVFAIREFISGVQEPPLTWNQLKAGSKQASDATDQMDPLVRSLPVLATFKIDQALNEMNVVRYTGKLAVYDMDGNRVGEYNATTGGFAANYKRKYGPTPPGYFVVSNYRKRSESWCSRHGIGFTFDIDEVIPTGTRGDFRIHPDGPPPGTHGCVGIVEDGDTLKDCAVKLREALAATQGFRLHVEYA